MQYNYKYHQPTFPFMNGPVAQHLRLLNWWWYFFLQLFSHVSSNGHGPL